MAMLQRYDYPGNVREPENIVERAVVIARQDLISSEELPFKVEVQTPCLRPAATGTLKEAIENLEHLLVEQAMKNAGGHQTRAAESLGISERMLRYKLKKYRLK